MQIAKRLPRLRKGHVRITIDGRISDGKPDVYINGKLLLPGKIESASIDMTTGSPVLTLTLKIDAGRVRIDDSRVKIT